MFASALNLNAEQKAKAEPLMDRTRAKIKAIQAEAGEKVQAALKEAHAQLEPLLNDEQRMRMGKMREHMSQHMKGAEEHRRPGFEVDRKRPEQAGQAQGFPFERAFSALNLTPEQKEKVKTILEESRGKMKEIAGLSDQDKAAKSKEMREAVISQIRPILTPDQQKKLEEMKEHHGERHDGPGGGVRERPKAPEAETRKPEAPKDPAKPEEPKDKPL